MAPAHLFQSALAHSDLERFYREVRHTSEWLGEPLSDADATVQWTRSPVLALPALPRGRRRGRRLQWQVHVRAIRFARRLLRDAAGNLRASYPGAHALAIRGAPLGGERLASSFSAIGETKGETK
jgi:hypothetical protein